MKAIPFLALLVIFNAVAGQNKLESYLIAARQNSPLINENLSQKKINELEAGRIATLLRKPQAAIVANYLFAPVVSNDNGQAKILLNPENAINYYGYDLSYSNGGVYQAMFELTQPIAGNSRVKTAAGQFLIASSINDNNMKLDAHELDKLVTDQYIVCVQGLEQIGYMREMCRLVDDQRNILNRLVNNGIYKQSDLLLLNIESDKCRAQLTTLRANYRRDLTDLNILCGIYDTNYVELSPASLALSGPAAKSLFLEKFALDSLLLQNQQHVFELKYKPQVSVFANTGLNAVYAPTIPRRFGLSAGLSLTYTIYDGKQKNTSRRKTEIALQNLAFKRNNFLIQNEMRKTKLRGEIDAAENNIRLSEQQLAAYEKLLDFYKQQLSYGQISVMDFVNVLKNISLAQSELSASKTKKQLLINTFNYWNW